MIVQDLIEEAALHAHDETFAELSLPNWLMFAGSASRSLRGKGWLIQAEDDATLITANTDWEYEVPAGFAYIHEILLEDTVQGVSVYTMVLPQAYWAPTGVIRLNSSGVPIFSFTNRSLLLPDRHMKVVGQKRPTVYSDIAQTVDAGTEAFMLERMLYYAFRYLGVGGSDLSRWRQTMSQQSWGSSEALLHNHPQEFRVLPDGVSVPGRA